ncbi:MAG: ABC transporter ATP-binding protein, partial [Acidimicrobiia bacterium]
MSLQISNLSVTYGNHAALADVNLDVAQGERFAVMGPSGAGKSTLLRVLAGLEEPTTGTVVVNDEDVTSTPAHERPVGLMFQDNALFPHMSVLDNVAYGLRMQGMSKELRAERAEALLDLVSLAGFEDRNPTSLSGGEQQRVALARTLAPGPSLVLFDEPLGAIDQTLKDDLLVELMSIVREVGTTSVYVTHDRIEAETFAEHMAILRAGRVVAEGTP